MGVIPVHKVGGRKRMLAGAGSGPFAVRGDVTLEKWLENSKVILGLSLHV